MSLKERDFSRVPAETYEVAWAAYPKGHVYMRVRDELGDLFTDERFAPLFVSERGRPAESPGRLAWVTVLQAAENLDDRAAADQVRGNIAWKYLLGLSLSEGSFDYSVLSEFRQRVIQGGLEAELLQALLERLKADGRLKKRGLQRTDATHVVAAVRELNRLECVGETLRYVLNSLAAAAPRQLRQWVPAEWFDRYGQRFENARLPSKGPERDALAVTIGRDGLQLLAWCYGPEAPPWLREVEAVDILRRVWIQQYYVEEGREGLQVRWRTQKELPPHEIAINSPYDVEAHYATKRETHWVGYKVHLTETCDVDLPHFITNVETTPSTAPDCTMTATIHQHLAEQELLPSTHLVDAGYVDAEHLVTAPVAHQLELLGPVPEDPSWQARAKQGFGLDCFVIDWERQVVTCPQGHASSCWSPSQDRSGYPVIHIRFPPRACQACPARAQCTRDQARTLTFHERGAHEALHTRRQEQHTADFKQRYKRRAGIEGTLSQGVRHCGLRRARYRGLAKTHLQHIATAAAINLMRLVQWLAGDAPTTTRCTRFAKLAAI
jgi:transposase